MKVDFNNLESIYFIGEIGINHNGDLSIARGATQLTDEDTALVFTKSKALPKLKQLFEA